MAKKKYSSSNLKMRFGDVVTPERHQHSGGIVTETTAHNGNIKICITRQRAKIECKIDHYWQKQKINDLQRIAALRFREIYLRVNCGYSTRVPREMPFSNNVRVDPEWRLLKHIDCIRVLDGAKSALSAAQLKAVTDICVYDSCAGNKDRLKTFLRGLDKLVAYWRISHGCPKG